MFAIAGRCRRSLLLQTVSRSLTEPTHISRDADSNSRSSTIRNSVMAMKSWRVPRGQPASRNAFAMLQLLSLRICSTLGYLVWIVARLWVLARVASFCWGCCWGSSVVRWRRVLSSDLSSAIVLLASANLVCRVLMTSDFVCTRLANSSASFSCYSNSTASSWFCRRWFWKDWPTLSWSFTKASYFFFKLLVARLIFRLLIALEGLPLLFWGGWAGQEHCRLSPEQTPHLLIQWKIEWSPPQIVHFKSRWDIVSCLRVNT